MALDSKLLEFNDINWTAVVDRGLTLPLARHNQTLMRAGGLFITSLENPPLNLLGRTRCAVITRGYITLCTVIIASEAGQICQHIKSLLELFGLENDWMILDSISASSPLSLHLLLHPPNPSVGLTF